MKPTMVTGMQTLVNLTEVTLRPDHGELSFSVWFDRLSGLEGEMSKLSEAVGKVGAMASIAQCVNVGPFARAAEQVALAEQRHHEELSHLSVLLDKPRKDVLERLLNQIHLTMHSKPD
jgi:hypothetical protein